MHLRGTTATNNSTNSASQQYDFDRPVSPANSIAERRDRCEFPEIESNLDEVALPSPIFDLSEKRVRRHKFQEDVRSQNPRGTAPSRPDARRLSSAKSSPLISSIDVRMSGGLEGERSAKQGDLFFKVSDKALYSFLSYILLICRNSGKACH